MAAGSVARKNEKAPAAVLIAGPTASGKSALALALAERLGDAVIVNADSMQVYRELRILTARPSPEEEERVPHRLYGHVSGAEAYSAGAWARDVAMVLEEAHAAGRTAIFTGGTGLYFKALTEGLSAIPDIPASVREQVRREVAGEGSQKAHERLAALDPVAARLIPPSDPQRIARALEVVEATGRPLSSWQAEPRVPVLKEPAPAFVMTLPRGALRERIDARFDAMMAEGALSEVRALDALGLAEDLPVMRALGVRPLRAYLRGECALEDAVAHAKAQTRQFAKRQDTWFRTQMIASERVNAQDLKSALDEIFSFICDFRLTGS